MNFDFWVVQYLLKRFRVLLSMSPDAFEWNKLSLIKFQILIFKKWNNRIFLYFKEKSTFCYNKGWAEIRTKYSHTLLILELFSLLAIRFYFGHRSIRIILSKIEPSFHQCFISMSFLGFTRHLLISHKFCLLADSTLGYFFFHVLKIKLSK